MNQMVMCAYLRSLCTLKGGDHYNSDSDEVHVHVPLEQWINQLLKYEFYFH